MEPFMLGILLTLAAGMCTTLGAASVLFVRAMNRLALAGCLGLAAGVMIYVSLVDMLQTANGEIYDGLTGTAEEWRDFKSLLSTSSCFFCGWAFTSALGCCITRWIGKFQLMSKSGGLGINQQQEKNTAYVSASCAATKESFHKLPAGLQDEESTQQAQSAEQRCSKDASEVGINEMHHIGELKQREHVESAHPTSCKARCSALMRRIKEAAFGLGPKTPQQLREIEFAEESFLHNQRDVLTLGVFSCVALTLHNIPEGVASFFSTMASPRTGVSFAVAIGVHNIPEGISIAMPIYYSTNVKWPAFFLSFISGVAELLGALLAYAVVGGEASHVVLGAALATTAGVMANIGLNELLPAALKYDPCKQVVTKCAICGAVVIACSLVLFAVPIKP